MQNKPCIQCGYCCINMPCGLATRQPCEHLVKINNLPQYRCEHYPFDHLDAFEQYCLEAGEGCGYDGGHDDYVKLNKKLKIRRVK